MADLDEMEWRHWPGCPAGAFTPDEPVKTAMSYEDNDVSSVAESIRRVVPAWVAELPPGIDKLAAARDGTDEELVEVTRQNIWRHPNAHPVALSLLLLDKYGKNYLEWDSEVLRLTMQRDGIQMSNRVWARIQAVRVLFNSPTPWRRWEVFHWVAQGLAGNQPSIEFMEEPEIGHLMVALDVMHLADRGRSTEEEVDKFIAAVLLNDGIVYAPAPLSVAQRELDQTKIHCENCGAVNRDDNDVRCIVCASTRLRREKPHADLHDRQKALWESRSDKNLEAAVLGLKQDDAGQAVYRLLVHWDYRNRARAQLVQQLRMIAKTK